MEPIISVSGIRGNAQTQITPLFVYKLGIALNKLFPSGKIVLGYDPRPSSEKLYQTLYSLFGKRSLPIGIASTPSCQEAVRHFGATLGVMITASHNPKSDNGIKIFTKTGRIISPEQAQLLNRMLTDINETNTTQQYVPEDFQKEMIKDYHSFLFSIIAKETLPSIVSILIDVNGGAGIVGKGLLEAAGLKVDWLGDDPGYYHRDIEPTQESLQGLLPHLKTGDYHLAAAFDGDADRVELLSAKGTYVSGQQILGIVIDYVLSKNPGRKTVILNEVTSGLCQDIVKKHNCTVHEVPVGEYNVVKTMEEEKSIIGGESSGVIIAPSQCRDGWLTLMHILAAMQYFDKDLDELNQMLPKYVTLSAKIPRKEPLHMENLSYYLAREQKLRIINSTEVSLKAKKDNTWLSIRASNTEVGIYRIMADAPTHEQAQSLIDIANNAIEANI